jgi:hypothetical protein
MKKIILASVLVVAAIGAQPAFAAGPAGLCTKGMKLCACGKLPGAMWNCCNPRAKCDCSGGIPNCKH